MDLVARPILSIRTANTSATKNANNSISRKWLATTPSLASDGRARTRPGRPACSAHPATMRMRPAVTGRPHGCHLAPLSSNIQAMKYGRPIAQVGHGREEHQRLGRLEWEQATLERQPEREHRGQGHEEDETLWCAVPATGARCRVPARRPAASRTIPPLLSMRSRLRHPLASSQSTPKAHGFRRARTPPATPSGTAAIARAVPDVQKGFHHSSASEIAVGSAAVAMRIPRQAPNGTAVRRLPDSQASSTPAAPPR